MRITLPLVLMISALAVAPSLAAAPQHSALEDWKAHRAIDRADTLIVAAPYDSVWRSTVRALNSMEYKLEVNDQKTGQITTTWGDHTEFLDQHGAEWMLTDGMIGAGVPPALTSPECPHCWFTVIHDRRVIALERVSPIQTRVIISAQYVGVPRGKTDPIALQSTGAMERALLKRLMENLGY